ncbi:IS3 family transposase [Priestia megaterium]|uniref:IS3 family transposase n=1 Tax=Priestia megaterium TaxID=1404 RepID=UPI00398EC242
MKRFSKEEKLMAVKKYLSNEGSFKRIGDSIGADEGDVRSWVQRFQYHGDEAFKNSYARYSVKDKLDVLNYMKEQGTSIRETAAIFNIKSRRTLKRWQTLYENGGIDALKPKGKRRPSMKKIKIKQENPTTPSIDALQAELEYLRAENAYFKKVEVLSSENISTREKAEVVHELRKQFNLKLLLLVSNLARSTYYYWVNVSSNRSDKYGDMKNLIQDIFHHHKGRYGYRRITLELRRQGYVLNHKTVRRLMKELGLKCLVRVKKYRSYKGNVGETAPNVLQRDFQATQPNQKWVTDVTEFHLFGKKLYLSPILDLFNGEIISYHIESKPIYPLVGKMLDQALKCLKKGERVILHSDQGWHYRMSKYKKALQQNNIIQSMSRKGNCLDNAVIENFFGLLKSELLYLQQFKDMDHFERELKEYIHYYNNTRIKEKLKGMSPVEYRTHANYVA